MNLQTPNVFYCCRHSFVAELLWLSGQVQVVSDGKFDQNCDWSKLACVVYVLTYFRWFLKP